MRAERRVSRAIWMALPLVAIAGALVWWPVHQQSRRLDRQIERAHEDLAEARRKAERQEQLSDRISRVRQELDAYQQSVPRRPELTELFASLTGAIHQLGLRNPDISSGSIVSRPGARAMPIQLTFSGGAVEAFGLLRRIETMPRLIQPTVLVMEAPDQAGETVLVELQLEALFREAERGER